ncbi:XrtA/PEP-CTERM system histidine kinase PrsK [Hahella sp. SMD15-11]|uniref:histidine kinase n=1 Tax=Thermohahella caldifontis TaxID=3142973 RepID=A0AB39UYH1_9GAMM
MTLEFGAVSYLLGSLAYLILTLFFLRSRYSRHTDRALTGATFMTSLWSGVIAAQQIGANIPFELRYVLEVLHTAAWMQVLFAMLNIRISRYRLLSRPERNLAAGIYALIAIMLLAGISRAIPNIPFVIGAETLIIFHLTLSLLGLILLEQVWLNLRGFNRSSTKFLGIALAGFLLYDGAMYTDAMMTNQISPALWDSRGIIHAILAPLIALTLVNAKRQPLEFQVSREFIFRGTVMVLAGLYLMLVALAAWLIQEFGTGWSDILATLLVSVAVIGLLIVTTSRRLRARLIVFLGQHFFDYKYDYREEWLKVTRELAIVDDSIENAVIRVLANAVNSPGGLLWVRDDNNNFEFRYGLNQPLPKRSGIDQDSDLVRYFTEQDWIINLQDYNRDPTAYHLIEIPEVIRKSHNPWLIVPLHTPDSLLGFVVIAEPYARQELNWENYDLLRIIARQACSYLALYRAQQQLTEAKQFEAVTQTSAFLIHDLKTIIAQLNLLLSNAGKHKNNPAFIDDMLKTTEHAVKKMSKIVEQVRKPVQQEDNREVDIIRTLRYVIDRCSQRQPVPRLTGDLNGAVTIADPEQLKSVFTHIITNAQDATPKDGDIEVSVKQTPGWVFIFVQDTGKGMDTEFIRNELFKPFASTKGVSGMGIGAYQSREYLRKLGGSLEVTSEVNVGSCFTLRIPTRSALAYSQTQGARSASVRN